MQQNDKPKVSIHKFTSCDGCQLAFVNADEALITLSELVDIRHFVEAGLISPDEKVDIAFIEGSISTPDEIDRIKLIRENTTYLIAIGACATSGGIQALRNFADHNEWMSNVYAEPNHIDTLSTSTAISKHVKVDLELWGCPINTKQVMSAIRSLLFGVTPVTSRDSVCLECKKQENVCVLVAGSKPCMGPVTKTACGALCPSVGRDCYGCYGPSENPNTESLKACFSGLGLLPDEVTKRFRHINSQAEKGSSLE